MKINNSPRINAGKENPSNRLTLQNSSIEDYSNGYIQSSKIPTYIYNLPLFKPSLRY